MEDIKDIFQINKARDFAVCILENIQNLPPKLNPEQAMVDYNFDISGGKMGGVESEPNTWISFNSPNNDIVSQIGEISRNEDIEKDDSYARLEEEFMKAVSVQLCEPENIAKIESFVRNYILGGASKKFFPLDSISLIYIDLNTETPPIITVKNHNSDGSKKSLPDLIKRHQARMIPLTQSSLNEIVEQQKKKENILYEDAQEVSLTPGRTYDIGLGIYVDYSPIAKEKAQI